ncbi:ferredoxin [Streptomyces pinistramenti]|uniref:ferredoxin n=1 Tax=Streptomyces pinistramenti TaxID=2884812 RepID=UPI001D05EAF3|nr:ferredoxin [Streptomyces pinistramenti]MCB5906521.1 ferredoxin [Streptomyces pinistramenti]
MTWQVEVAPERCIASGMCAGIAPDLFTLDGTHSQPVHAEIPAGDERALDAADICPAMAITIREKGEEIGPRP